MLAIASIRRWCSTTRRRENVPDRGLVEVACWAHTRRHFHQALENDSARMGAVLAYIAQLYGVEKKARQAGIVGEELRLLREQGACPCCANCMRIY